MDLKKNKAANELSMRVMAMESVANLLDRTDIKVSTLEEYFNLVRETQDFMFKEIKELEDDDSSPLPFKPTLVGKDS